MFDMSDNIINEDVWYTSEKVCPNCKNVYVWVQPWWDDAPQYGGSVIGKIYKCGNCDYYESF